MYCHNCGNEVNSAKFCPECGAALSSGSTQASVSPQGPTIDQVHQQIDLQRQQLRVQQQQLNMQLQAERSKMFCPKCHGNNVIVQAVAEQKKRGCLMSLLWIVLAICTIGAIIWVPLLIRKGSKTRTYAVCQSCGFRWRV